MLWLWKLIRTMLRSKFNSGPFTPEIDACSRLDQFSDIGAPYARGGFAEVEAAIVVAFDEFGASCALNKSKRADDFTIWFFQGSFVSGPTENGTSPDDATFLI